MPNENEYRLKNWRQDLLNFVPQEEIKQRSSDMLEAYMNSNLANDPEDREKAQFIIKHLQLLT